MSWSVDTVLSDILAVELFGVVTDSGGAFPGVNVRAIPPQPPSKDRPSRTSKESTISPELQTASTRLNSVKIASRL